MIDSIQGRQTRKWMKQRLLSSTRKYVCSKYKNSCGCCVVQTKPSKSWSIMIEILGSSILFPSRPWSLFGFRQVPHTNIRQSMWWRRACHFLMTLRYSSEARKEKISLSKSIAGRSVGRLLKTYNCAVSLLLVCHFNLCCCCLIKILNAEHTDLAFNYIMLGGKTLSN